jgi:uncharacterized protein YhjY with autotransporter beta-barrel domain
MILKKIFSFFLIFNLTFVSTAKAATTTATTFVDSFDFSAQEGSPTGLTFSSDGTKMFVTGVDNRSVFAYTLTTAFDVSTASNVNSFDVADEDIRPWGLAFNNDGTKMFVVGFVNQDVNEYTLTTDFDVSTAVFVDGFDVSGQDTQPVGLAFNNNGTKMFVLGGKGVDINEYTLTTGFDVSTASFVDSFDVSGQDTQPQGLAFNTDGTKMFHAGLDESKAYEYTLTTGFDVSTASLVGSFDVSAQDEQPRDLAFNNDGTKMFVIGSSGDDVYEYNLSCAFKVTSSSKCDAPSKIKEVRGLINAQIETAKNFADKSSGSALKRLSQLRSKSKDDVTTQNFDINFSNPALAQLTNLAPNLAVANLNPLHYIVPENWASWMDVSASLGKIGDTSLSSAQYITALGISLGADKKNNDNNKVLGVALRLGHTDVDVGTYGSSVDTNAISFSYYGSNTIDEDKFIDHVIGASHLRSDIVRRNSGDTNKQKGDRRGNQIFGSLKFGREFEINDTNIIPTGRMDSSYTILNDYTESGHEAIKYGVQYIGSLMASLGLKIDRDDNLEKSILKSRVNLEYGKDFASNSKVVARYITGSSTVDTYQAYTKDRDILKGGLGFDLTHEQGLTVSIDYERKQILNSGHINTFSLAASFLSKKETEFSLGLNGNMTSNFKISKTLGIFDLGFNLENDFSNQENHNANLSISSQF